MDYTVKLLPAVHSDLLTAKNWYNEQKDDLGEEFKIQVNKEINYIKRHPEHYQTKYKQFRQSLVTRFPYAIFYLIEESKKQIIIFGVLHTSRNPKTIKKRID